jgi:undecaprenyl-diphosphatase
MMWGMTTARVERPLYCLPLAAAGVLLVVVSAVIADNGRVSTPERVVFEAINGLPDVLRWPMWVFQLPGLIGLPLVVAGVAMAFRRVRLAIAAVLAIPLKLYVEQPLIKELVDRQRPGRTQDDPVLRDVPASGESFPSGHAVVAFTLAVLLTPYLGRRWRIVVWALATLNAVARVYLGAHNPLDVVAGAGAGLVIGGVLTLLIGVSRPSERAGVTAPP